MSSEQQVKREVMQIEQDQPSINQRNLKILRQAKLKQIKNRSKLSWLMRTICDRHAKLYIALISTMFIYANTLFAQIPCSWSSFSCSSRNSIVVKRKRQDQTQNVLKFLQAMPYSLIFEIRINRSIRVIVSPDYRSLIRRQVWCWDGQNGQL